MAAREDIYRRQYGTSSAAPLGQASEEAFGAGVGAEIAHVGAELHQDDLRARRLELQRQTEGDAAAAGAGFAKVAADIDTKRNEFRIAAPPGAVGHVETVDKEAKAQLDTFLGGIPNERVRQRFSVEAAQLAARVHGDEDGWAAGVKIKKMGGDFREATGEWVKQLLVNPDPQTLEQALRERQATVGAMGVGGAIGEGLLKEAQADVEVGYAKGLTRANPAAAALVLKSGILKHLTADQLDALQKENETDVRTAEADARRVQSAAATQARESINLFQKRLADHDPTITDDEIERMGTLAKSAGLDLEAYDLAKAHTQFAVDKEYRNAPSPEISADIRDLNSRIEKAGDKASPDDVVRRDRLQSLLTKRSQEEAGDPLTVYSRAGGKVSPIAWSDPGSIAARVTASRSAQQQTGTFRFFTPQEEADAREEVASGPAGRLEMLNRIALVGELDHNAALRAAEQVAPGDATFRHALRVAPNVRGRVVRGAVLRGTLPNKTIGADGKATSVDAATQAWFGEHALPALRLAPPELADDALETARDLFASLRGRAAQSGEDTFNAGVFGNQVNLALGGNGGGVGGLGRWRHGPKAANGQPPAVLLPSTMTEGEFDRRMAGLPLAKGGGSWPAGSVNGVPAWANGQGMGADNLRGRFVPVAVSDGVYEFHAGNDVVMTKEAHPKIFRLDVRKIEPAAAAPKPKAPAPHLAPVWIGAPSPQSTVRGPVWFGSAEAAAAAKKGQ